jgi:hypothetical protein
MEKSEILKTLTDFKSQLDVIQEPYMFESVIHSNTKIKTRRFNNTDEIDDFYSKIKEAINFESENESELCNSVVKYIIHHEKDFSLTKKPFFGLYNLWKLYLTEKPNTEYWTIDDFKFFLDNETLILIITIINDEANRVNQYLKDFERLRAISNQRFKVDSEQNDFSKQLKTATQKVVLMYELGIFDLLNNIPEIKDNPTKIAELVSVFTGLKVDTIRQPYRTILNDKDTSRYNLKNSKNETAINEVYKKIGIERKKR